MIYAVVRYPKKIKYAEDYDFNIYSKQSSNKEKMQAYFEEISARYPNCYVHLVSREKAKQMKTKWFAKLLKRDQKMLDAFWRS